MVARSCRATSTFGEFRSELLFVAEILQTETQKCSAWSKGRDLGEFCEARRISEDLD
jgi:hypothetical protein